MKPTELLIVFFLVKLTICDDSTATTQHVPDSCGRIKLKDIKSCNWWPFCKWYKLHFYDLTTTNDTVSTDDNIECNICKLDPHGKKGEYTKIT